MSADQLTPRQRAFVRSYVHLGGTNGTAAAIAAGYSGGGKVKTAGASVQAHRLLRDPRILAAIRAETDRNLQAGIALGARVLQQLAEDAKTPAATRLAAAQALLDRGGLQLASLSQHHVIVEDKRSPAELLARVAELQRDLGMDARPALHAPEVTDAVVRVAAAGYTAPETPPRESVPTR